MLAPGTPVLIFLPLRVKFSELKDVSVQSPTV